MKKIIFTPLLAAAVMVLATSSHSDAGTLTIEGPFAPSFTPVGGGAGPAYTATQPRPDLVTIMGNGFTQGDFGSPVERTITFNGTFTSTATDLFSVLYNLNINLDRGAGSLQFNLFIRPPGGILPELQVVNAFSQLNPGDNPVNGSRAIPLGGGLFASGTYRGELIFTIAPAAGAGDESEGVPPTTVTATINDLSLQVAPTAIPEPSTYALVVAGGAALLVRLRRRRSA